MKSLPETITSFNFSKWNKILGWTVFGITLICYALTTEPTVSFWDAGEYILTSSKLQVGHPPGAPLFQMLGAFFSTFTFGNNEYIGMMMNMMSGVASAFTILFMFWSITLLLKRLVNYDENSSETYKGYAILGSGLVGSLAFAFTDSFWFNAVETEVYAMAILIMSIMFYLALRWEQDMDKPRGNRWLILIAFVIGLSFGVHFMGLLTIPAIGLIYYFKNFKTITVKNFIIANVVSVSILLFIFKLLLPNALRFFGFMEVFIVNNFGLPFHSGTIIAGLIVIALFYFGLKYTKDKGFKHANTLVLCLMFIFIGFSSWMMLPIRANAKVIINENDPSDARELLAYYNLEQYPETHLFWGPQFTEIYSGQDPVQPFVDDKKNYEKNYETGEYEVINNWKKAKQNYNHTHAVFLPRMWSSEHAENYMMFTGYVDFKIQSDLREQFFESAVRQGVPEEEADNFALSQYRQVEAMVNKFRNDVAKGRIDYEGYNKYLREYGQSYLEVSTPSFSDNLDYLLQYQLGYMYWRYFMWNFVGRQNDVQGKYDAFNGNWISGINMIDEINIGLPQNNLPSDVKNNKARNTYYFLPLILGLVGLLFLAYKDQKRFWVMLVFFLFTGLAIQVYTNVRPFEPRERDYSVVGSFYVFAIWIGFGVYGLIERLKHNIQVNYKYLKLEVVVAGALGLIAFLLKTISNGEVDTTFNRVTTFFYKVFFFLALIVLVLIIIDLLCFAIQNIIKSKPVRVFTITAACLILVPGILVANNWDDHDRSGKYTALAMARKYLESCDENSILFTIGDNDSFPLWYLQEIEGVRTDVRVVNTSLFQTDWYIDQMKRKAYESDPIPSQLTHKQYRYGTRDYIMRREITKDTVDIKTFMNFLSSDEKTKKIRFIAEAEGDNLDAYPEYILNSNYFPTRYFRVPVDKENVLKNGIVKQEDADEILPYLDVEITSSSIYKNRLLMLDIIANNNWERSIYFSGGAFSDEDYIWMKDYLQLDGMCYKLVPIKTPVDQANPYEMGRVDSDLMYNMVKTWDWGGSGEDIYHDIETRRNGITYRGNLARLIEQLINEEKFDKAEEIADLAMEKMPLDTFEYYTLLEPYISAYYEVDKVDKARDLFLGVTKKYQEQLTYFSKIPKKIQEENIDQIATNIERYRMIVDLALIYKDEEFSLKQREIFNEYIDLFSHFMEDEEDAPNTLPELTDEQIRQILQDSTLLDSLDLK